MNMRNLSPLRIHARHGFTLVEMVTTLVILGIVAAVAYPRFVERNVFDSRGYYDQAISTLRFAQKLAIAQRRFICVAFAANSITLTYDPLAPGAAHPVANCPGLAMVSPAGVTPYTVTAPTPDVTLSNYSDFNFDALGRPSAAQSMTVSGYGMITVEAETGYVH